MIVTIACGPAGAGAGAAAAVVSAGGASAALSAGLLQAGMRAMEGTSHQIEDRRIGNSRVEEGFRRISSDTTKWSARRDRAARRERAVPSPRWGARLPPG